MEAISTTLNVLQENDEKNNPSISSLDLFTKIFENEALEGLVCKAELYKTIQAIFESYSLPFTILLVLVKEIFELLYEHTENPTAQTTSDCRILTAIYSRLIFLESLPFSGSYKSQKKNFFQSLNSNKETEISNSIKDNFKVQ